MRYKILTEDILGQIIDVADKIIHTRSYIVQAEFNFHYILNLE